MIGVVDYGAGNLFSVGNALKYLDLPSRIVSRPSELKEVAQLILPGVGSFGAAVRSLEERDLMAGLRDWLDGELPFLGICLGMQLMAEGSAESPGVRGLGRFPGRCEELRFGKRPHMGWAPLREVNEEARRCLGLREGMACYFVHSYALNTDQAAVRCDHEDGFAAVIGGGRCWGVQFHPEKSGKDGLEMLRNWREVCR